ncbi:hypothetical protein D8674_000734 [Pyrus ussuriensis x Pyrus communis]|uniref:Uncharacterized protein n=1 Tax=Pyrus ussuriensis x Pyrus communis TaxID=2448454 RepID=A0A5N5FHF2_9ROSA|nr:hypothetical protein D8674_000734 [Pyrus ussuriensis x Pyrus communis]
MDSGFYTAPGLGSDKSALVVEGNEPKLETKANPDLKPTESRGMDGVVVVPQPVAANINVFKFGSVTASADKVTITRHSPKTCSPNLAWCYKHSSPFCELWLFSV